MKNEILLVFPQGTQLDYMRTQVDKDTSVYVILQRAIVINDYENEPGFVFLNKECTKEKLNKIIPTGVKVLCCHEEGLYWLKINGCEGWIYPFDKIIFSQLSKDKFKDYVKRKNIKICEYTLCIENIKGYPIIAKPSIGFGSIGVKKINSRQELDAYSKNYSDEIRKSAISSYADKYFANERNVCIFESFVEGEFYRIPFLVYDGIISEVFPARGIEKTVKNNSDFHWTGFEFGKSERKISGTIKAFLQSVIEMYKALNGSFVAEVMMDKYENIVLLEFSPRQTSTRLSKLIYFATGVDLEKSAINFALTLKIIYQ